ncbi:MAG: molybdopterin molybdenumtransferase MoeA, partial [Chloroflexi bacterium]
PVSALVNGYLFVVPLIENLLGLPAGKPRPSVKAKLTVNLASQAGREDWQPVKLVSSPAGWLAEPVFGKSNLIFTLACANGLVKIHADATGLGVGEIVEVFLMP